MTRHSGPMVVGRAASRLAVGPRRRARAHEGAIRRLGLCLVLLTGVVSCHDEPTSGDIPIQGPPELVAGVVDTGRVIPGGTNTFVIKTSSAQPARLFFQATSGRAADTLVAELVPMANLHGLVMTVTSVGTDTTLDDQVSGALYLGDSTTYMVTVRGAGADDAGTYRLLLRVADPGPESRVRAIAVSDTIGESIDQYGDIDEFSFDGTAGEEILVFFQTLREQPDVGLVLTLMDSATRTQLRTLASGGGKHALEDVSTRRLQLAATGRYVVRIEGSTHFTVGARNGRGPYRFLVSPVRRAPESTPSTVAIGDTVTEAIDAVGDIDEFTFDGTAGQEVDLNLQILGGLSSGVSLEVWHGQSRDAVATTRVQGALDDCGTGRFTLPATGAYTVRLYGADVGAPDSVTGRYRFEIYTVDRSPETASAALSIGNTLTGESVDRPGDVDEFTFAGLPGEQLQVFFNRADSKSAGTLSLEVVAPDGTTTVGRATGGPPGVYSPASHVGATGRFTMSAAGTYTVRVHGSGMTTGAYTVELYHIDPAPEHVASAVPSDVWVTGESLDRPGDVDEYTIDATAGQRLVMFLTADPESPGALFLFSGIADLYVTSRVQASPRFTFPETGPHRIKVVGDFESQSGYGQGPYEFMVYAVDPGPETASAAYTIGDTLTGESIDRGGDIDEFTFAATAGESLDLFFDATDRSGVERAFVLDIVNARTGATIIGVEAINVDGDAGSFVVPSTDSYRITIDYWLTSWTGAVTPAAVGPYRFAITPHR